MNIGQNKHENCLFDFQDVDLQQKKWLKSAKTLFKLFSDLPVLTENNKVNLFLQFSFIYNWLETQQNFCCINKIFRKIPSF